MRQLRPLTAKPASRSSKWTTRRASMHAKGRTSVKGRVAVKPATMAARPRTRAKARVVALPTVASPELNQPHNLQPPGFAGRWRYQQGAVMRSLYLAGLRRGLANNRYNYARKPL